MRILIDIGHPAHVHLFKNFAWEMQKKGHIILFTCREKEFEISLLKTYGFNYITFGKHYINIVGKLWGLIKFDIVMFKTALDFKPDLFLSAGSMYAAQIAFFFRKPHIALEDSENMEQIRLYKPFTKFILTPNSIPKKYGKKQLGYNGFHQSAYLHPNYFQKNLDIREELGIGPKEKVFLLRLVALNASHDWNLKNISDDLIHSIINLFKDKGHIFISSEKPLKKDLQKYKLNILPERIHDFISICDLIVGESGAMTNEAAYLGVPNILIVDIDLNVHKAYTELGLKKHFKQISHSNINEIELILNDLDAIKLDFQKRSDDYIKNSVDLTNYLIKLVESLSK